MARLIPTATTITYATRVLISPSSGASLEDSELSVTSSLNAELLPTVAGVPYPTSNRNVTGEVRLAVVKDYATQYDAMVAKKDEEAFANANPVGTLTVSTKKPDSSGVAMSSYTGALTSLTHTLSAAGRKVRVITQWDFAFSDMAMPSGCGCGGNYDGINQLLDVLEAMSSCAGGVPGRPGKDGKDGKDGVTFTPQMDGAVLSWTNDGGLENPEPVDLGVTGSGGSADLDALADFLFSSEVLESSYTAQKSHQRIVYFELREDGKHYSTPLLLRSILLWMGTISVGKRQYLVLWEDRLGDYQDWRYRACSQATKLLAVRPIEFKFDPPVVITGKAIRFGLVEEPTSKWPEDNSIFTAVDMFGDESESTDESWSQGADGTQYYFVPTHKFIYSEMQVASGGGTNTATVKKLIDEAITEEQESHFSTPSGGSNALMEGARIASTYVPTGELTGISLKCRDNTQGLTSTPLYLSIWETDETDNNNTLKYLGSSTNSVVQQAGATHEWLFDGVTLNGKAIRIAPQATPNATWPGVAQPTAWQAMGIKAQAVKEGDTESYIKSTNGINQKLIVEAVFHLNGGKVSKFAPLSHARDTSIHLDGCEKELLKTLLAGGSTGSGSSTGGVDANGAIALGKGVVAGEKGTITIGNNAVGGIVSTVVIGGSINASKIGNSVLISGRACTGTCISVAIGGTVYDGSSVAVGIDSSAYNSSVAVGVDAAARSYAAAMGESALAMDRGVAIGYNSSASECGVALGQSSKAAKGSVAIGSGAKMNCLGIMLAAGQKSVGNLKIVFFPHGSPLAKKYTSCKAGMGYISIDRSGKATYSGAVSLDKIFTQSFTCSI